LLHPPGALFQFPCRGRACSNQRPRQRRRSPDCSRGLLENLGADRRTPHEEEEPTGNSRAPRCTCRAARYKAPSFSLLRREQLQLVAPTLNNLTAVSDAGRREEEGPRASPRRHRRRAGDPPERGGRRRRAGGAVQLLPRQGRLVAAQDLPVQGVPLRRRVRPPRQPGKP
jgi:hypothetical protein